MLHIVNYSRVSNNLTLHVYGQIKRSHSIHMLSIQIDTKTVELVIHHQFKNIKFSSICKLYKREFSMFNRCCTVMRYSRVSKIQVAFMWKEREGTAFINADISLFSSSAIFKKAMMQQSCFILRYFADLESNFISLLCNIKLLRKATLPKPRL